MDWAARWDLFLLPRIPPIPHPRLKGCLARNKGNFPWSQEGISSPSLLPLSVTCSGHKGWRQKPSAFRGSHVFPGTHTYTLIHKGLSSQSYGFSSSHVWMWELDHKEGWALKNWCFQMVVLEKTLKSPLDSKVIKPVNPKGNQPWIVIGWIHLAVSLWGDVVHKCFRVPWMKGTALPSGNLVSKQTLLNIQFSL